jgi:signal transduction histidine kinase
MFATRPTQEATHPRRQSSSVGAPRILVVEDDVPDAQLVELELRRSAPDLVCQFVSTVQEARLAAKSDPVDLILLDLQLPDSRGLETLGHIRSAFGNTPVVVLTGQVDVKLALASLRSGARDYLTKNDIAQLEPTLRRVLAEAAAEREKRKHELALLHTLELESVERLAAGLAHELNSPIQFVGDNLVFLRKAFQLMLPALTTAPGTDPGSLGDATRRSKSAENAKLKYALEQVPAAIEEALAGVSRVARLVATMKDRLGPPRGQCSRVAIRGLLESSLWRCREHWQPVAELSTDYAADVPELLGYPDELAEAFVHLIIDTAESVRRRGQLAAGSITIATRRVGENVELRIGDNGHGVSEKDLGKVLDPLLTTTALEEEVAAGQGLSLVWAVIVHRHAGAIHVENAPGHGATYIVCLPLSVPHAALG